MVTTEAKAQIQADATTPAYDLKAGGGLVYGTEIENLGLQINGYYRLPMNDQIFAGADLTYFLPDTESFSGGESSFRIIALNFNGQYHFFQDESLGAYGLAGINYAMLRSSADYDDANNQFDYSDTNSEIGLNLGGGVEYQVDFGMIYGELKFVLSDFDQLVIGAGVRIPIER